MKNLSLRTLNILHWTMLAVAGLLIVIELIQMLTGQRVNQVIAWAAIILILIDLAITKYVRKPKSEE